MKLRAFNRGGIEAFREFLRTARHDPSAPVPMQLLEDDALTSIVDPEIDVESQPFKSRRKAAEYFRDTLQDLPERRLVGDAGFWTWLTLLFFDAVSPPGSEGRSVYNDYYYVFEPTNSRHYYRHLLFISWRIITSAPEDNRLYLNGPLHSLDKVTTEVFKRLYLTRIPCIFEVLDRLYWDDRKNRARVGIVDTRKISAGDLTHRFPVRIRQLEMTYDLLGLSADDLIGLLGEEFQQFDRRKAEVALQEQA